MGQSLQMPQRGVRDLSARESQAVLSIVERNERPGFSNFRDRVLHTPNRYAGTPQRFLEFCHAAVCGLSEPQVQCLEFSQCFQLLQVNFSDIEKT